MKDLKDYKIGEHTHILCDFCKRPLRRAQWEGAPALYQCDCTGAKEHAARMTERSGQCP